MADPVDDDFEELYELLSKAKERYRSARATVVHTVDGRLAKEANRRFVDWRFDGREPGMGIIGKPGWAAYVPRIDEQEGRDIQFAVMADPSDYIFHETFWDGTNVGKTGREVAVTGRACVEVLAETVSWGYPPYVFNSFHASSEGATDHLLLVDAEIGTILRVAARLEGREFRVAEATEIAYDERFPEDTFRLVLPGVEFEVRER
jgi:hypothetical protein